MDLISKQAVLVNDPGFFQMILDHVANGGELIEFCKMHEISFPATLKFVRQTKEHRDLYDRALEDKDQWTINTVRRELRDLSSYNLADMFNDDGTQKQFIEFPDALKRAIVSVKKTKDGTEIRFVDKVKLLEMLGRSAGMFKDKVEHSGKLTLESLVAQSMRPKPSSDP